MLVAACAYLDTLGDKIAANKCQGLKNKKVKLEAELKILPMGLYRDKRDLFFK